jgi:hypothetical protein
MEEKRRAGYRLSLVPYLHAEEVGKGMTRPSYIPYSQSRVG